MLPAQLIENDAENMSLIEKRVKGKTILLVTEQISRPRCTYSVIGHYLFHILKTAGANVIHHDVTVSVRTKRTFDIGIYCHYETVDRMKRSRLTLKAMRSACKELSFYANLVPSTDIAIDHYFLSRKCFLDIKNKWYSWWQYTPPKAKAFKQAVFVGRGIDPFLLKPEQREFMVCLDSRFRWPIKQAKEILTSLEEADIKVKLIGFNKKTWKVPKLSFHKIAELYNASSVFIATIPGIYEMPAVEAQCSGNAIISYRDCLPNELCCPKSSFICHEPEDVVKSVLEIKDNHDVMIPRNFVSQWTWTSIIEKMSRYWD